MKYINYSVFAPVPWNFAPKIGLPAVFLSIRDSVLLSFLVLGNDRNTKNERILRYQLVISLAVSETPNTSDWRHFPEISSPDFITTFYAHLSFIIRQLNLGKILLLERSIP